MQREAMREIWSVSRQTRPHHYHHLQQHQQQKNLSWADITTTNHCSMKFILVWHRRSEWVGTCCYTYDLRASHGSVHLSFNEVSLRRGWSGFSDATIALEHLPLKILHDSSISIQNAKRWRETKESAWREYIRCKIAYAISTSSTRAWITFSMNRRLFRYIAHTSRP